MRGCAAFSSTSHQLEYVDTVVEQAAAGIGQGVLSYATTGIHDVKEHMKHSGGWHQDSARALYIRLDAQLKPRTTTAATGIPQPLAMNQRPQRLGCIQVNLPPSKIPY